MLSLLEGRVSEAAAPLIFLALFLIIVGGALWLTPRLARWLDQRAAKNKSYFDGMLEEAPPKTTLAEEDSAHDKVD